MKGLWWWLLEGVGGPTDQNTRKALCISNVHCQREYGQWLYGIFLG